LQLYDASGVEDQSGGTSCKWKNYHGNHHVKKDVKKEDKHMEIVMEKNM
jgi:hypothetical protein